MIFGFKVLESIFTTLIICCDNVTIMDFSQMIKLWPIQSDFDSKYQFIRDNICKYCNATNCTLAYSLTKGLGVELFTNK